MALKFTQDDKEWTVVETIAGSTTQLFCKAQNEDTILEMWVDRSKIVDSELE